MSERRGAWRAARLCAALLYCMCTGAVGAPAPGAVPPAGVRLGDSVKPLAYDLQLTIVPREERFSGRVRIEIEIAQATSVIWLNASRLDVRRAQLTVGARTVQARVQVAAHELLGLHFAQPLAAGHATLALEYEGGFDRSDSEGVFKLRDADEWYVYTQFEPVAARRAFPCFDEPGWKTPWKLELTVPAALVAVANTPSESEDALPGGLKRVRFAASAPLPTYLVAFAVGPFDVVDGASGGRNAVPIRYIVPKGHAGELRYASQVTARILEIIEEYVGLPYPFEKLDLVAVPASSGFGAMENAGLVTIASELMLVRAEEEGPGFRESYASTAAHELAHQWFGDLVTMQWWDDLWLSESFADWQSDRTLRHLEGGWLTRLSEDGERQEAIAYDRLASAHPMRAAVTTRAQIDGAFDAINYQKGAALLRMIEDWLGEDRLRNGVRRYLAAHAFGNARASELVAALAAEAGPDGDDLLQLFTTMTEQQGVPALDIALDCGADGRESPRLILNQHRFAPMARQLAAVNHLVVPPAEGKWVFPACFQYGDGADFGETCAMIRETRPIMDLPAGEKCPIWVVGNRRGASYFLPILSEPLEAAMLHAPLLPDEAIAVLGDTRLLSQSGDLPVDQALVLAARFADSRQPPVADAAVAVIRGVAPSFYARREEREGLARFVRAHFGERAIRLGWVPRPDERAVDNLLRVDLLPLVADLGDDAPEKEDALRRARDWLAGRLVLGDMLRPVLVTAAHFGAADLFDGYLAASERSEGTDRSALFAALGSFHEPALADRALALVINDKVDARDARLMFTTMLFDPVGQATALHFLDGHYDELMRRLGEDGPGLIAASAARLCDAGERRDFERSFGERLERALGGPRALSVALESADLCIGSRSEQLARLHAFLVAQNPHP